MLRSALVTFLAIVLLPATVQAFDHDHHHHHHHDSDHGGDGCGTSHEASSSPSPEAPSPAPSPSPDAPSVHKRVFVTSTTYSGALGGLDAADHFCQSSAAEHGLGGQYRAWLSAGTTDAYDRIAGDGPWDNTAGEQVFASKEALRAAPPAHDLLDETGQLPAGATTGGAWSGSDIAGVHTGNDCAGWTDATDGASASMGTTLAGDPAWGGGDAPSPCSAKAALICIED